MGKDILSDYGRDSGVGQNQPRATNGGVMPVGSGSYSPPRGPTNIMDSQSPGLHGDNYGNCGSQGCSSMGAGTSGSPGLGGTNRGMGTNRKG